MLVAIGLTDVKGLWIAEPVKRVRIAIMEYAHLLRALQRHVQVFQINVELYRTVAVEQ
jgi:hypothetical protein